MTRAISHLLACAIAIGLGAEVGSSTLAAPQPSLAPQGDFPPFSMMRQLGAPPLGEPVDRTIMP